MPKPRNVKKLLDSLKLKPSEWAEAQAYFREDPRVTELKAKKTEIEAELAALTGGTVAEPKRRGRKPGSKAVSMPAKTGKAVKVAKGKPGRKKAVAATEAPQASGQTRQGEAGQHRG